MNDFDDTNIALEDEEELDGDDLELDVEEEEVAFDSMDDEDDGL